MAFELDEIRALAARVAATHHLDVVDVEFSGGARFRSLRVFVEKDAAERAKLKAAAESGAATDLPEGVPAELLSGVTHEDCAQFAHDFGTLLDVEDRIPGADYTLEVSSPGLERKLTREEDYVRFTGSLVKFQTFAAMNGNRHFVGRLVKVADASLTFDLTAVKPKGKGKKAPSAAQTIVVPLSAVEKANLVAEI